MDDDRLSRVEAQLAIQQLAIRYAIAVDSRDLDLMAAQWLPDVNFGRRGRGPEAVKAYFDPILRVFYRTMHMIVGHRIDLIDAEHATGVVYCRAEHESGRDWIVQAIVYSDEYQRVDDNWYFATRRHHHWYSTDIEERPKAPTFENWKRNAQRYRDEVTSLVGEGPLADFSRACDELERLWADDVLGYGMLAADKPV